MEEWDHYRLGHRAVGVLARSSRLNVQSGPSKDPHQGSSWAALGPRPKKREDIRSCQRPKFLTWEPSQAVLDHRQLSRSFVVERVTPRLRQMLGWNVSSELWVAPF